MVAGCCVAVTNSPTSAAVTASPTRAPAVTQAPAAATASPTVDLVSLYTDVGAGLCRDKNNQGYWHLAYLILPVPSSIEVAAANYCGQNMVSIQCLRSYNNDH